MSNKNFLTVDLLNIQFGVGFGAIFTFLFKVNLDDTIVPSFHFSWTELVFLLPLFYYSLDWYYANTIFKKFTNAHIIIGSIFIWILASQVILLKGSWGFSYLFLAVYFGVVGLIDILGLCEAVFNWSEKFEIFLKDTIKNMTMKQKTYWVLQGFSKILVGVLLFFCGNEIIVLCILLALAIIIKWWRKNIIVNIIPTTSTSANG